MTSQNEIELPSATPTGRGPFVFGIVALILALAALGLLCAVCIAKYHIGSTIIIICLLLWYFKDYRKRAIVLDTPTSKVHGVFIGRVELQGTSRCDEPTTGYLSEEQCVWTEYVVEEHYRRVEVYEEDGETKTRTKTGWERIDSHCRYVWFELEDDTGLIAVDPENANMHGEILFNETVTPYDDLYWGMCDEPEIDGSTHKRRFIESTVRIDIPIYLFGYAHMSEESAVPYIAWHETLPMYEICVGTEKDMISAFKSNEIIALICIACTCGYMIYNMFENSDGSGGNPLSIFTVLVLIVLSYLLLWLWTNFNRLINIRQRVHEAFAHLDVQYKRRADMIPNLIETVKGYRDYEAGVMESVTALRALADSRRVQSMVKEYETTEKINLLCEAYPELKASENFLFLQKELSDTETRIALASQYYNDFATNSNTRLLQFPMCLVAKLAMLQSFPLITLIESPEQRPAPLVGDHLVHESENTPTNTDELDTQEETTETDETTE